MTNKILIFLALGLTTASQATTQIPIAITGVDCYKNLYATGVLRGIKPHAFRSANATTQEAIDSLDNAITYRQALDSILPKGKTPAHIVNAATMKLHFPSTNALKASIQTLGQKAIAAEYEDKNLFETRKNIFYRNALWLGATSLLYYGSNKILHHISPRTFTLASILLGTLGAKVCFDGYEFMKAKKQYDQAKENRKTLFNDGTFNDGACLFIGDATNQDSYLHMAQSLGLDRHKDWTNRYGYNKKQMKWLSQKCKFTDYTNPSTTLDNANWPEEKRLDT